MNEFVVDKTAKLTPQQVVMGTMGISLNQLIAAIRENRGGQFDRLYKKKDQTSGAGRAACPTPGGKGA